MVIYKHEVRGEKGSDHDRVRSYVLGSSCRGWRSHLPCKGDKGVGSEDRTVGQF